MFPRTGPLRLPGSETGWYDTRMGLTTPGPETEQFAADTGVEGATLETNTEQDVRSDARAEMANAAQDERNLSDIEDVASRAQERLDAAVDASDVAAFSASAERAELRARIGQIEGAESANKRRDYVLLTMAGVLVVVALLTFFGIHR